MISLSIYYINEDNRSYESIVSSSEKESLNITGATSCLDSFVHKKQTRRSSVLNAPSWGGGLPSKVLYGEAPPEGSNSYHLLYYVLIKWYGTFFIYLHLFS